MSAIPQDLLQNWLDLWGLPPLWAKVQRGETTVSPGEVVQHLCEAILEPLSPVDALLKLLSLGEFAAAEEFLYRSELQGAIENHRSDVFAQRLREMRAVALRHIEEQGFLLRERSRRLGHETSWVEATIERARAAAATRLAEAESILQECESQLIQMEAQRADHLNGMLQERLNQPGRAAAWAESVRSAILSRDFLLAGFLLDSGADVGFSDRPVPWRRNWPFGRYPDRVIAQWFRGQGEGLPRSFSLRWGVPDGDENGARLLAALHPLVMSPDRVGKEESASFLDALSQCLDARVEGLVSIGNFDGGYWARVQGLRRPGFHAFSPPVYDQGVVFLVPSPRALEEKAADGPFDSDADPGELPSLTSPDRDEIYVTLSERTDQPLENAINLDFQVLFRLLGDESRAHNFLREVGTRLPLTRGFPGPFPINDGRFVVGREEEQQALIDPEGPILWLGPPSSGRSTLLKWAATHAREAGWGVADVGTGYGPGGFDDALTRELSRQSPGWDPSSGLRSWLEVSRSPGVLIVVDNVDHLPEPGFLSTIAALSSLQARGGRRVRCLATALPRPDNPVREPPVIAVRSLSPYLDFADARRVVATISDYLGILFEPVTSLDRFVYLSGGHVGLLHLLFWELLAVLGERESGMLVSISPGAVDRAFQSSALRAWLGHVLALSRARQDGEGSDRRFAALLRMTLASMLLECEGARSATVDRLRAWPEIFNVYLKDDDLLRALRFLAQLGLVMEDGMAGWQLPPAGFKMLLAEVVGEPEAYLEESAAKWVE